MNTVVVHDAVDDGDDDVAAIRGVVPSFGGVDIGVPSLKLVDSITLKTSGASKSPSFHTDS